MYTHTHVPTTTFGFIAAYEGFRCDLLWSHRLQVKPFVALLQTVLEDCTR